MMKLSQLLKVLSIGNPAEALGAAYLKNGTYNSGTNTFVAAAGGVDMILTNAPASVTPTGNFLAASIWNAVWNDIADFQDVIGEVVPGKCYFDTWQGAKICNQRCQMSVIGIASDTFGFGVGANPNNKQVPIAVSGWVLAFVDKEYAPGTPLTNDAYGFLTEMTLEEKRDYPERLVALYKKPEKNEKFGTPQRQVLVNGRHWVKVK